MESPEAGLLFLASGHIYFGLAIPPFLMENLYCSDPLVIASVGKKGIPRDGIGNYLVGEAIVLCITIPCTQQYPG